MTYLMIFASGDSHHFILTSLEISVASLIIALVGAISGLYALFVKRPKIVIESATLIRRPFPEDWVNKDAEDFKSSFIEFEVEILVANYMAESGSITKPGLIIKANNKSISQGGSYGHSEWVQDDPNRSHLETYRYGRSFIVPPYGREDDRLKYTISDDPDKIEFIVKNSSILEFELSYKNHKGKDKHYKIAKVIEREHEW